MDFRLSDLQMLVENGGWAAVPAILVFIIFTNLRGDWRTRREYMALAADRDEWKAAAKTAIETSRDQQDQVHQLTGIVEALTTAISKREP